MQEFIQMAMSQLGTDEQTTRAATGGLLDFVKKNASPGDADQLLAKLPGASDLLAGAASGASGAGGGGGLLGGLASQAMGAVGGNLGAGAGLLGLLQQSGLDSGKAGSFLSLFVNFAKEKAGTELVSRLVGQLPGASQLLGSAS